MSTEAWVNDKGKGGGPQALRMDGSIAEYSASSKSRVNFPAGLSWISLLIPSCHLVLSTY